MTEIKKIISSLSLNDIILLYSHFGLDPNNNGIIDLVSILSSPNYSQIGHMNEHSEELIVAIENNKLDTIKNLIKDKTSVFLRRHWTGYLNPLIYASYISNYTVVEFLLTDEKLKEIIDINSIYFYDYLLRKNIFDVKGADQNRNSWPSLSGRIFNKIESDVIGKTALMVAKDPKIVELLLNHGADPNEQDLRGGKTALMFAILNKLPEIVKLLCNDPNIDIGIKDKTGYTAIDYAITERDIDSLELLLAKYKLDSINADINLQDPQTGKTILMIAVEKRHMNIIQWLLINGANVNIQDSNGDTALMQIVKNPGDTEYAINIMKLLVRYGARLDLKNNSNESILMIAVKIGNPEIVKTILIELYDEAYANVYINEYDSVGYTILHYAVLNHLLEIVEILLEYSKININIKDTHGDTVLHLITISRLYQDPDNQMLKLLLKNPSIDVNIQDREGLTPLHHAVINRDELMVRLLLEHPNIDIIKDSLGRTPMFYTIFTVAEDAFSRNFEKLQAIMELLLKHPNSDVNIQDRYKRAPLHYAVIHRNELMVRLLLKHPNININIQDVNGRTPLFYTTINSYPSDTHPEVSAINQTIQKLLLEKGAYTIQSQPSFTN